MKFSSAYQTAIVDQRRRGPWFAYMVDLIARPETYRWLDAAQLVKHAFGLAHTFQDRDVTLLYLFWEPLNVDQYPVFAAHRAEIARFAAEVANGAPTFKATSYPELWREWSTLATPTWLASHVAELRSRYELPM